MDTPVTIAGQNPSRVLLSDMAVSDMQGVLSEHAFG
jgi:hypothetical protein